MTERWKPVVGFEGAYEVSDHGRVRSLARIIPMRSRSGNPSQRTVSERILRPGPSNFGHLSVVLGKGNTRMIHRLVLEAFVGPCPPGCESCHGDKGTTCNRLDNLRWDTRSNNIRDAVRQGTWFSEKRKEHNKKLAVLGRNNFLKINAEKLR